MRQPAQARRKRSPNGAARTAPQREAAPAGITRAWVSQLWPGVGVFGLALLVRLLYLYESSDNPTFWTPIVDSRTYDRLARAWAEQGTMGPPFFWQPFFYPFVLGLLYKLSGGALLFAKIVQAVVGALTCLVTWRLGARVFDRTTGLVAGLMLALCGPVIFFEGELLAAGWAALAGVVVLLIALRVGERQSRGWWLLAGLAAGVATMIRPTFLPFMLAVAVWLVVKLVRARTSGTALGQRIALGAVGFALVVVPVAVQQTRVVGSFGFLPVSGGANFYIGNNENVCDTLTARPGTTRWFHIVEPSGENGDTTTVTRSRALGQQARAYAWAHPGAYLGGLVHKTLQFLNGREVPRNVDIYMAQEWSALLRVLVWKVGRFGFPWGLLCPLAIAGLVLRRRQVPLPMVLLLVLYPAAVILVFVSARYRVPIVPIVVVAAAAGCVSLAGLVQARRWVGAAAACAGVLVAAVLFSLPKPSCEEQVNYGAEMFTWLGDNARDAGDVRAARAWYETALTRDPEMPTAHLRLGYLCLSRLELDETVAHMNAVLERETDYLAYYYRGCAYMQKRDDDAALTDFAKTIELEPRFAPTYTMRGWLFQRRGEGALARADWERILSMPTGVGEAQRAQEYLREFGHSGP